MPTRQRGFSLLELMVTIAVVAILLAIAVPSFRDVIRRSRVTSASNELLASMAYARTEAITRGQIVSMCPSNGSTACVAASKAYETGWLIYTFPAGTGSINVVYAGSSILLRSIPPRAGVSIQAKSNEIITFGQQGQLKSTAMGTSAKLDFVTCFRSGSSGTGTSTTTVPGAELKINGSGGASTLAWAAGSACTPL